MKCQALGMLLFHFLLYNYFFLSKNLFLHIIERVAKYKVCPKLPLFIRFRRKEKNWNSPTHLAVKFIFLPDYSIGCRKDQVSLTTTSRLKFSCFPSTKRKNKNIPGFVFGQRTIRAGMFF